MSPTSALSRLLKSDAVPGILLILSAALAMVVANSSFAAIYNTLLEVKVSVLIEDHGLSKPLILWINDGLMAVFFFLIGLELKREMVEGKLKNPRDVILPGLAAVGGMAAPALIFLAINAGNAVTQRGWAIPAATDIAFAVGVLALLGRRVPPALKVFLLTLAILDDMGAIVIIALFYTQQLHTDFLLMAVVPLAALAWRHWSGAHRVAPTILIGAVLWVLILESGIHPTLAGVVTAFFVPLKDRFGKSPLHALEDGLTPYVYYLIVPIFAFANAGVSLGGLTPADMVSALPLGIAGGLVLGKQAGVFGTTWLLIKLRAAQLPEGTSWHHIWGLSCLAGIGFTMSLFIGSLSFDDALHLNEVRFGVLVGSAISAVLGFVLLRLAPAPVAISAMTEERQDAAAE